MRDQTPLTSLERFLNRLYEVSLRALPASIRRRWAADMRAVFARRLREATATGGAPAAVALGSRELGSIVLAAFQSRVGQATGRDHRAHDAQDGSDVWRTDPVPAYFYPEDRRPLKLATMGALVFHFALFLVVFPGLGDTAVIEEPPTVLFPKPYVPPPLPKEIEPPEPVVKNADPWPIPDPTPRDPEPIYDREVVYTYGVSEPVSTEFDVGAPVEPPAPPQDRVRAGLDVERPRLLEKILPAYPELAVRARLECVVFLEAVVGRTGDVVDVRVLRGCGLGLDESALTAVRQWKYTPTTINGRPVEVIATVTVNFELR